MGGDIPASYQGFNRFLDGFESIRSSLNPIQHGDDVGRQVDGDVSGDLNHELCTLIEESCDALGRCGHDRMRWLQGRELNPQGRVYEARLGPSLPAIR